MLVLYGSQTGTAQDVAESFNLSLLGLHVNCRCYALDKYDIKNLIHEQLALFVCSTTGQGEPSDNMMIFWKFIMRKCLPRDSLSGLKFAVLGLGDSSYAKYNFVAKKLSRRLSQLGAEEILPLYLADDQHEFGADIIIDKWFTDIWKEIIRIYPLPNVDGNLHVKERVRISRFSVESTTEDCDEYLKTVIPEFYNVRVLKNTRVTPMNHFQETRLIEFNISNHRDGLQYFPGDIAMILPSNSKENVDAFLQALKGINSVENVQFTKNFDHVSLPNRLPKVSNLRQLATHYFDIMSVPRRSFFQILHQVSGDELEKEKLYEFASVEGSDERISYVNRPRRSVLEVLQDFHNTASKLTLDQIIDAIPAIQPRAFSIASSPSKHSDEIHLLVAVVQYKTNLKSPRKGLCSTWLAQLQSGDIVPMKTKKGGIIFPKDISYNPIIMIGPGTGVSPFRSAIQEYASKDPILKYIILIFGCRNQEKDFYFKSEWDKLYPGLNVITAFSRDQEKKIYVQDKIKENGKYLWQLINDNNASIFLAGSSKNMPDAVKSAFLELFKKYGELGINESEMYLANLQKNKRYQQETWS